MIKNLQNILKLQQSLLLLITKNTVFGTASEVVPEKQIVDENNSYLKMRITFYKNSDEDGTPYVIEIVPQKEGVEYELYAGTVLLADKLNLDNIANLTEKKLSKLKRPTNDGVENFKIWDKNRALIKN